MRDIMTKHKINKIYVIIGILFIIAGTLVVKQFFLVAQTQLTPDNTESCVSGNWVISGVSSSSACIALHLPGTVQTYEGSGTMDWYNTMTLTCPTNGKYVYDYCTFISSSLNIPGTYLPGQSFTLKMISNIGRVPVAVVGYENLITCGDNSYNYRSACPKPITCSDINRTIVYDISKCPVNPPPLPPDNLWTSILNTLYSWLHDTFPAIFK